MPLKNFVNVPNFLTLFRLVLSPIMLPILLVYLLPLNILWINLFLAGLFVLFSITDFLDGYIARRFSQVSSFGRILDPIADKFLIYSTLVALLAVQKIFFAWVLILIGREFFVLGLRLLALENKFSVQVSVFGKIKTCAQVLYLTVLIANPYHACGSTGIFCGLTDLYLSPGWNGAEFLLMVVAVGATIFSAYRYYKSFVASYTQHNS
jgi:CDP-diacylglycerol---glycerol-3-phosphate 3-phosphatidyltransferase